MNAINYFFDQYQGKANDNCRLYYEFENFPYNFKLSGVFISELQPSQRSFVTASNNGDILIVGDVYSGINIYTGSNKFDFNNYKLHQSIGAGFYDQNNDILLNKNGTILTRTIKGVSDIMKIYTGSRNSEWIETLQTINYVSSSDMNDRGNILCIGKTNIGPIFFGGFPPQFTYNGGVEIYTGLENSNYLLTQIITGSVSSAGVGSSVVINNSGTMLAVGGYGANNPLFNNFWSVDIYTGSFNSRWEFKQNLVRNVGGQFSGFSLSINSGDVLAIGNNNIVYIYTGSSTSPWSLKQSLTGKVSKSSITENGNSIILHENKKILIYTGSKNLGWNKFQEINNPLNIFDIFVNNSGNLIMTANDFNTDFSLESNIYRYPPDDILLNLSGNYTITGKILNRQPNFFTSSNYGGYFANNSYVQINNFSLTGDFFPQDFTLALVYDNLGTGGSTLISTIETGVINVLDSFGNTSIVKRYKGFEFGITANNNLYFEYYTNNGSNIFTSDFSLGNKASVFLSVVSNEMSMGYYNFYRNELISNTFYIQSEYLFNYSGFYLGYNPNAINSYSFNKPFTGIMDSLLIYSPSIYEYDLVNLNSGFVHNYLDDTEILSENLSGVVLYQNQITGYEDRVTGYTLIPTGVLINEWGIEYTGYYESGLTGSFPLYGVVEYIGTLNTISSGTNNFAINYNLEYANTFGKNYINILSKVDNEDIVEVNLIKNPESYNNLYLKNSKLDFQSYLNKFNLREETSKNPIRDPLIFVNGQLHLTGNYYYTGSDGYNSGKYPENDYYIDESNNVIFANEYNQNDITVLDYINNYTTGLLITGFSSNKTGELVTGIPWKELDLNYYLNGQKLMNGIHYNKTTNLFTSMTSGFGENTLQISPNFNLSMDKKILAVIKLADRGQILPTGVFIYTGSYTNKQWSLKNTINVNNLYINDGNNYNGYINLNTSGNRLSISYPGITQNQGVIEIYTGDSSGNFKFIQSFTGGSDNNLNEAIFSSNSRNLFLANKGLNTYSTYVLYTGLNNYNICNDYVNLTSVYTSNIDTSAIGYNNTFTKLIVMGGNIIDLSYQQYAYSGIIGYIATGKDIITGNNYTHWIEKSILTAPENEVFYSFVNQSYISKTIALSNNENYLAIQNPTTNNVLLFTGSGNNSLIYGLSQIFSGNSKSSYGSNIVFNDKNRLYISYSSGFELYVLINNKFEFFDTYKTNNTNSINNASGDSIFMNLTTGVTGQVSLYDVNSISLQFLNPINNLTGDLIAVPNTSNIRLTGFNQNVFLNTNRYLSEFSEIYKNGIRQKLGVDYLELGSIDSNIGTGFFDIKPDLIYNNEDFFNI